MSERVRGLIAAVTIQVMSIACGGVNNPTAPAPPSTLPTPTNGCSALGQSEAFRIAIVNA